MEFSNMKKSIFCALLMAMLYGCSPYDNFTTYFNTYYNATRLIRESEDEFLYQEEKKRVTPRVIIPEPQNYTPTVPKSGPPPFMTEFVVEQQKLQPVKIKLDSVIIKGSKILANHGQSDYIEGALFLMAKAYFYRNEWLPSQIKCGELIDKFPAGDLSPDAHLLFAENMLIQRRFFAGKNMLSRTVDIAWQKKRYDILSQAFRLQADLAIFEHDIEAAVKPYRQAIAQCDDNEQKAKWQVDMASIYYKIGKFPEAERAFAKVQKYSPDYQSDFEAKLYRSMSLIRIGRYEEAEKILADLEDDGKYTEWKAYVFTARLTSLKFQNKEKELTVLEKYSDSAFVNNPSILSYYFEKGVDAYKIKDYPTARKYFARTRNQKTQFYSASERLFYLLNTWEQKHTFEEQTLKKFKPGETPNDTIQAALALNRFELGRVHEELGNKDSALVYYKSSAEMSPKKNKQTSRYLYAYSRIAKDTDPILADSLMEVLVDKYPDTDFGKEALQKQGYTEYFVIDTIADLYRSGNKLRESKEYTFAVTQFQKIWYQYPGSDFAPRSLYALGWVFEKNIKNIDSALFYYQKLIEKYPTSEYAKDVQLSVNYLLIVRSGKPIPDSLKVRAQTKKPQAPVIKLEQTAKVSPMDKKKDGPGKIGFDPMEVFKDPTSVFQKAKDAILNPDLIKPEINLPKNPLKMFDSNKDSTKKDTPIKEPDDKKDSTKKDVPIPIEKKK